VTEENIKLQLASNPDFVNSKRFDYSIVRVEEEYPHGCPDHIVADLLNMTPAELEVEWDGIVVALREKMGVKLW
jgi:hypothetical protein